MARRRFFVDGIHRGQAEVTADQAHHLRNVLRVQAGQLYELSDNHRAYLARVSLATKKRIEFEVIGELPAIEPPVRLHLYLALIKFDRLELALEKTTELGAERIVPFLAARSEKGLEKAARKRVARWRKITHEASQQSRRLRLPAVEQTLSFTAALGAVAGQQFFLDEDNSAPPLARSLPATRRQDDVVALLLGPEGGWTDNERNQALAAGWSPASLGPQVLRAETAAIAATAIVMNGWLRPPAAP